jgi:hypothetical protein
VRRASPLAALVVLALVLDPSPARAQVTPGWYVIPSLSLAEEYDSNVFGSPSNEEGDFITRISPGVVFGYQSVPFTILGRYSFGAEFYADNSDLNGINRHSAGLDVRYLPNPRLVLALGVTYNRSESTPGQVIFLPADPTPPPTAAVPAPGPEVVGPPTPPPTPVITGVETGRQTTEQYVVAPSVSYQIDPVTSASAGYAYSRSKVEDGSTDNEHSFRLGVDRRLSALDRGSLSYIFRYFDSEGDEDDESSHTILVGYGRQLGPVTNFDIAAGPRISDQGEVNAEAHASITHQFRQDLSGSLAYSRTQDIVTGRGGAQTVDSVVGSLGWIITRDLGAGLSGRFSYISDDEGDEGDGGDTRVYSVVASLGYRITAWLSATLSYVFTFEDETGPDDITRHIVTLSLTAAYPFRVY